jgi:predicted alpha/beta-hydrolase family hydrolase
VARLASRVREIETPSGTARATLSPNGDRGLAVIGHGAGGGIDAPDLIEVATALVDDGWTVARVEQPYRVRGRRAPEAAPRLDAAWTAVIDALREEQGPRLVVSGRSSGARVACRTASAVGADAVVALAFPLHPPGKPEKSRAEELTAVTVPCLVVQGSSDPFGTRSEFPKRTNVIEVHGDHSLRMGAGEAATVVVDWLSTLR